jgi:large subunit ribosomal protein L25
MVPAVLYSGEVEESMVLAVPKKVVDYTLQHLGDNALYDMKFGDQETTARVVDVQRDPVSGKLMHVDFAPVNMRERIVVTVPLTVVAGSYGGRRPGPDRLRSRRRVSAGRYPAGGYGRRLEPCHRR